MANDYIAGTDIAQHKSSYLASVRAFLDFSGAILTSDFDVRTFKTISDSLDCGEYWSNDDFTVICICDKWFQRKRSFNRVAKRLVHLPVSSDYRFTHKLRGFWSLVLGL